MAGRRKRILSAFAFMAFSALHYGSGLIQKTEGQKIPQTVEELRIMEREIWVLLNEERASHKLPFLKLSASLSDVARKHSQDMSEQDELTHFSSSGKTLSDRLAKAGILYIEAGENVVKSETFLAEFINRSLIESPEHRENMLDPDFKEVGIGVVYRPGKGYFITQDFLDPLIQKSNKEARELLQKSINGRRTLAALPPLVFLEQREDFAENLSRLKAQGSELPPIPERFGETLVIFLTTPSLTEDQIEFAEVLDPYFDRAALGIWFSKTPAHPGGFYSLALMLFASNRFEGMSQTDQKKIILSRINSFRSKAGRKEFTPNNSLDAYAGRIVELASRRKSSEKIRIPQINHIELFSYGTVDLRLLPESLEKLAAKTQALSIGIGLRFVKNAEFPEGMFWVALVFD